MGQGKSWKEKKKDIVEWTWKDIAGNIAQFRVVSIMLAISYVQIVIGVFMPIYDIVLDGLLINKMNTARIADTEKYQSLFLAYVVFAALRYVMLANEYRIAIQVIKSDSVTESFLHSLAYQYHASFWYDRFCFFRQVQKKKTWRESSIIFVSNTLDDWQQLLVDIPQFVILIMFTTRYTDNVSIATDILKIIALAFRVFKVLPCALLYLCIRNCCVKGSLHEYTAFRIHEAIKLVLNPEEKGSPKEKKNSEKKSEEPIDVIVSDGSGSGSGSGTGTEPASPPPKPTLKEKLWKVMP